MVNDLKPVREYIRAIERELARGIATEQTYRSALKALLESLPDGITATNEPRRIECGAPDFVVSKGALTIGYIEAKDVGKSLDEAEKSEQLSRYRDALSNLILTDYLEFRWYVDGDRRLSACLGTSTEEGKIRRDRDGTQAVAELLDSFLTYEAEGVGTPKELARPMARLAHRIREGVEEALVKGVASDLLSGLYKAFQETLIPGLEVTVFADMYSQTIAYGLFAGRCETANADDFSRQKAALLIPKTNPFLRDLFYQITGPDLDDEPYKWAVDELVQLLRKANMAEVLKDFGKGTGKDDPVVYFYEDFLREYDKKISEMRGVYYTPISVVSYIVRSIDYLLKNTFKRSQGLADENTHILDPATGTGTFLYAVINEIYDSMSKQGQMGKWDGYVANHLLPRIFGFELLMTPYVIAHLKLGLKLKNTGYTSQSKDRLGVYLTNTLEEAVKSSEMLMAQYIVKEANAAAEIKKEKPIMVVLGNPPYSGHSANKGPWARQLVEKYKTVDGKPLGEKNPKWLQDDYVKFLAFGQWRIELSGQGILGFITNHAYLDNPTFRGMRQSLMDSFTDIYVLNLHGSVKKKEVAPDGGKDENVFDIQQGVAISLLVRDANKTGPAEVHYAELWGRREGKYDTLLETDINSTGWEELKPSSPFYLFVPVQEDLLAEYEKGWKVTDIFPVNSVGIVTARDHFILDFDETTLKERISDFRATVLSDDEVQERFKLADKEGWSVTGARQAVRQDKDYTKAFTRCLYRVFDIRPIFYHKAVIERSRPQVMHHMLTGNNLGLIVNRQIMTGNIRHVWATRFLTDLHIIETAHASAYIFPLYLYPAEKKTQLDKSGGEESGIQDVMPLQEKREPNLKPEFIKAFSDKLGLEFIEDGKGDLMETFGPEDVFSYAYAVFHSPTYRSRYAEFLKIDFPRLPLTSDRELFKALADKGTELVSLHLMEAQVLEQQRTQIKFDVAGSNAVEKVTYVETAKRVYINKEQYFEGVPPEVWNFHIGGYQVCKKWLKDRGRERRTLTYDELTHYQKIVVALKETIRVMEAIDQLIPAWPLE